MDHSFDIPVVAGALPQEDPRTWLTAAVLEAESTPPTRVIAARSQQRLVAVDPEPDAGWIAAIDEALLADGVEVPLEWIVNLRHFHQVFGGVSGAR